MLEPRVYSVSQINRYIKNLMEKDFILQSLWVKGEVSNFKAQSSGHLYFTLKDAQGAIACVMFKGSAHMLPYEVENGMEVVVCGYVSLYEKTGQYQLYAELLQPVGLGALHLAYEQLKEKLLQEGLFDGDYKREISKNPNCVAVITSPTGAAVRDIIQIIRRRDKSVKIIIAPVLVQGEKAPGEIIQAIKMVNRHQKADTLIIGRGGGSIEDLWAFNDEGVARAIFGSEIPVISAVGHETDFTIADFVADLRAPTPSAAAELSVSNREESLLFFNQLLQRLHRQVAGRISQGWERLDQLRNRPVMKRPAKQLYDHGIYIENLKKQLYRETSQLLKNKGTKFLHLQERLEQASPLSALKRGYAIVEDEKGNHVSSIRQVEEGAGICVTLQDGKLFTVINKRQEAEYGQSTTKL